MPSGAQLLTLLLLSLGSTSAAEPTKNNFTVAAYLPEWRYEGANWVDISASVTQLILFSLEVQPTGRLSAHDRLPRKELMQQAREATRAAGCKLLICIGGNGRSAGFPLAVAKKERAQVFVDSLVALCDKYDLDGVDLNWEYPGYSFGRGYHAEDALQKDYKGLARLVRMLHAAFAPSGRILTLAYYPDGKQEQLFLQHGIHKYATNLHMMSYDQGGKHSTMDFADKVARQGAAVLPPALLTLGVPFYGRQVEGGEGAWKSYEDLVQQHPELQQEGGLIDEAGGFYLNGRATIAAKVRLARTLGLGGVMIWEVGQDCRVTAITHGDKTHGVTCPQGEKSSLLVALRDAVAEPRGSYGPRGNEKMEL